MNLKKSQYLHYECDDLLKFHKQAGVNSERNLEIACLHTICHNGAVKMVKSGRVDMTVISFYLGLKSVVLTESVYAKFEPTFMKESSAVMADVINF